ncbi:MAG: hypothetical protein C0601_09520 [Candidatus Muiribacterium halophilum]|uniref:Uncharacterized protein n=1 Tax=Muiribacterium halophilum TaxID=2053465 RepID=A0A2N5ZDH1_MUIH1|nr:MAG: hypothetical protein C0601_09520 [Candidatus Muirbacterium halophilum]
MKNILFLLIITILCVSTISAPMNKISIFDVYHNLGEFMKYQSAYTTENKEDLCQLIEAGQSRWGFEINLRENSIMVFDNLKSVIGANSIDQVEFEWKNKEIVDLIMSFFNQRIEKTKMELLNIRVNYVDIVEEEVHTLTGTDIIDNLVINYSVRLINPLNKQIITIENRNFIECL